MPNIIFNGKTFTCEAGSNLRAVLIKHGLTVHNGKSKITNCRGLGTCGTCAVKIRGAVTALTKIEKIRLNIFPHNSEQGLRLACQTTVMGDLIIEKGDGFWGHHLKES